MDTIRNSSRPPDSNRSHSAARRRSHDPSTARTATAQSTTTAPTRSRCSKASRRSASGRPCTSARPARRACITSSTRSSTTRSTRRWPASATRSTSRSTSTTRSRSSTTAAAFRSIMHDERQVGGRSRADRAARRRQVRQRQLQGLGRSARRRRVGRQRAVGVARPRDLAQRAGLSAELRARDARSRDLEVTGTTQRRGTKVTFKPDPQIFETTEYSFDTLAQRLRELAFLNGGILITHRRRARRQEPQVPVRRRHRLVRRAPEQEQGDRQRQADLHEGRRRTASTPRSRCSGTTATPS